MFFWNSLAFLMIQRMLAIWSLVPLSFLKPAWTPGSSLLIKVIFLNHFSSAWNTVGVYCEEWDDGGINTFPSCTQVQLSEKGITKSNMSKRVTLVDTSLTNLKSRCHPELWSHPRYKILVQTCYLLAEFRFFYSCRIWALTRGIHYPLECEPFHNRATHCFKISRWIYDP